MSLKILPWEKYSHSWDLAAQQRKSKMVPSLTTLKKMMKKKSFTKEWLQSKSKFIISRWRSRRCILKIKIKSQMLLISTVLVWWPTKTSCLPCLYSSQCCLSSCFPPWFTTTHSRECQWQHHSLSTHLVTLVTPLLSAKLVPTLSGPSQWSAHMVNWLQWCHLALFQRLKLEKIFAMSKDSLPTSARLLLVLILTSWLSTRVKLRLIKERGPICTNSQSNLSSEVMATLTKVPPSQLSAPERIPAFLWASLASKTKSSCKRSIKWHQRSPALAFS